MGVLGGDVLMARAQEFNEHRQSPAQHPEEYSLSSWTLALYGLKVCRSALFLFISEKEIRRNCVTSIRL